MSTPPSSRPLPQPTRETAAYWAAAQEQRLVIQRCARCGKCQFYPRAFCISCLCDEIEWIDASGLGCIYTFTVCRIAPSPAFASRLPYVVALIDLDEGVRLLANILDANLDRVAIGARVSVCFESVSESCTLPQFTLLD
ncbi:Zn-ribbon domain-containing OB-fold protein [Pseudomonas sp. PCH199]|uniref:Zn-ribbon domain-containing OB-fold protein n=1 Tax=unclassified Pseudomonas TaxID=196821 RepID=UPI000BD0DE36|nr:MULTISPECIES: Zn-ribbon domain-containing OB-fold protein [unclassified Pseudomonas]MCW8278523.1 Zn-ribbon domain-containing OB-fold protein [Pseudomonas sp. PCH199]PAM81311.1 hypothetical protein CES87_26225 [Pseudomonas sp. ERMR1:02]